MPAKAATTAAVRKEAARKSGMRKARQASIASARAGHHIIQAMPSKNLAVSAVPLDMPYIQRRPELEVASRPFKLVSDYVPAGHQPEANRQLIEGVNGGRGDPGLLGGTGPGRTVHLAHV